jgi:hypothetical protein
MYTVVFMRQGRDNFWAIVDEKSNVARLSTSNVYMLHRTHKENPHMRVGVFTAGTAEIQVNGVNTVVSVLMASKDAGR